MSWGEEQRSVNALAKVGYWSREELADMDRKATRQLALIHPEKMTAAFRAQIVDANSKAKAVEKGLREDKRRNRIDRIIRRISPPSTVIPSFIPNGQRIKMEVAARHGMTARDLESSGRRTVVAMVRHEAMYCIARDTILSLVQIGRMFNRDHSSVHHAIRRHADRNGLPRVREGAAA